MKKRSILVWVLALVLLPAAVFAAMGGPDSGVNSDWKPNQALAQTQSQGNPDNRGNSQSSLLSGVFSGTVELQGEITGVNRTENTFAINGAWINPAYVRDLARAAMGSGLRLSGLSPATAMNIWTNMAAGDRFHIRAQLSPGEVRVLNWTYQSPTADTARRAELQARLQALIQQVNQLMARLREMGALPNATSTAP